MELMAAVRQSRQMLQEGACEGAVRIVYNRTLSAIRNGLYYEGQHSEYSPKIQRGRERPNNRSAQCFNKLNKIVSRGLGGSKGAKSPESS